MANETILVTGATGQLGRLVLAELRTVAPQARLVGLVRDAAKARDLAAAGVELRVANYDDPASVTAALRGVNRVVLVSSSELGKRTPQHQAVIDAAKVNGVSLLVYTSLLRPETQAPALGAEHVETEAALRASGLPFVVLRNGWYIENYTVSLGAALQYGVVLGSATDSRIWPATRADYARAAAVVVSGDASEHAGRTYDLAGDHGFTMAEYAAEITRQSGTPVRYQDLSEADFADALIGAGLPEGLARVLAARDVALAANPSIDDSGTLARLLGRPTTMLAEAVRSELAPLEALRAGH